MFPSKLLERGAGSLRIDFSVEKGESAMLVFSCPLFGEEALVVNTLEGGGEIYFSSLTSSPSSSSFVLSGRVTGKTTDSSEVLPSPSPPT